MAEIRMSENSEGSPQSCYSDTDGREKSPQMVYFYSAKGQVKAEPPNDHDTVDKHQSLAMLDSHMKPSGDHHLKQRVNPEMTRSRGYDLGPEVQRCSSRGDHLSQPKRNWTRESITRYEEDSLGYSSQRAPDAIIHPQYQEERHITAHQPRKSSFLLPDSPFGVVDSKDYDQLQAKDARLLRDTTQQTVRYEKPVHLLDSFDEYKHKHKQYRVSDIVDNKSGHGFRSGRKSFMPIKVYPSTQDYQQNSSVQSLSLKLLGTEDNASLEAPPNVTLVRKGLPNHYETNEQTQECTGCREKFKRAEPEHQEYCLEKHNAAKFKNADTEERRVREPRSDFMKYDEQDIDVADRRIVLNDLHAKRFHKDVFLERKEFEDVDSAGKGETLTDQARFSPSHYKRMCLERPRSNEYRASPTDFRQFSPSDSRAFGSNVQKSDVPRQQDPKYRLKGCYVMRGSLDRGCSKYYDIPPTACQGNSHEAEGDAAKRFPGDVERRSEERNLYPQGKLNLILLHLSEILNHMYCTNKLILVDIIISSLTPPN